MAKTSCRTYYLISSMLTTAGIKSHIFFLCFVLNLNFSFAQERSDVPKAYIDYFEKFDNSESLWDRLLAKIGINEDQRSIALICGVDYYKNFGFDKSLKPAGEDIRKLAIHLEHSKNFDEIIVLKNEDFTSENLRFFFYEYLPKRFTEYSNSRFLFAFSGHGISEKLDDEKNRRSEGYLLLSSAFNTADKVNAIDLSILRSMLNQVVPIAMHSLVLVNSCYSGSFLAGQSFDPQSYLNRPGAHAITASSIDEKAFAMPNIGSGSVFFEFFLNGIKGDADLFPKEGGDGIITFGELSDYMKQNIITVTKGKSTPQSGSLKLESKGSFFFVIDQIEDINDIETLVDWEGTRIFGGDVLLDEEFKILLGGDGSKKDSIIHEVTNKIGGYKSNLDYLKSNYPDQHLTMGNVGTIGFLEIKYSYLREQLAIVASTIKGIDTDIVILDPVSESEIKELLNFLPNYKAKVLDTNAILFKPKRVQLLDAYNNVYRVKHGAVIYQIITVKYSFPKTDDSKLREWAYNYHKDDLKTIITGFVEIKEEIQYTAKKLDFLTTELNKRPFYEKIFTKKRFIAVSKNFDELLERSLREIDLIDVVPNQHEKYINKDERYINKLNIGDPRIISIRVN
ncbi:caspase family protein [Reichenbachiella sp.]|uniref:caspase family protein n=1 Tax=Reichenbachiella sp. TaxID=2184521 RepID=UPI00329A3FCA